MHTEFLPVIQGEVKVRFDYAVHFTTDLFAPHNSLLREVLTGKEWAPPQNGHAPREDAGNTSPGASSAPGEGVTRALFVVDEDVERASPVLRDIRAYFQAHRGAIALAGEPLVLSGGEQAKNEPGHVAAIRRAVNDTGLDRHSYLVVIGGGALLDVAGYAAATAHRGIRLIRVPTTTLSQNDSGVGVKNGVNAFGKKNFVGTFAPAWAVLNDFRFLETLPDREWRAGIAEAIKVALIKDAAFFAFLEEAAPALARREMAPMRRLIHRCAELHVQHICEGGDPFEMGSSRPLDFGHWSAHKLEQLTQYRLRHGEAVAIGLALDVTYSQLQGWLTESDRQRVLDTLAAVGFDLYHPDLARPEVFVGLREFREHLGGQLTIQMLRRIGEGFNVHEVDEGLMARAVALLAKTAAPRPVAPPIPARSRVDAPALATA